MGRSPMATEIGIVDLLKVLGFDDRLKSKLVRHQDARYDVPALIRDGWFDLYQSLQKRPVFKIASKSSVLSGTAANARVWSVSIGC